jgi:hypothetical protein
LREEEAATIAEARVINGELVAVIAEGERLGEVFWERLEGREIALPFGLIELSKADLLGPPLVAEAKDVLEEFSGLDDIVEALAELENAGRRAVGR